MMNHKESPAHSMEANLKGTILGVAGLLGVEFFPWDNVSFGVKYKLSLTSNSTTETSGGVSIDGPTYSNFNTDSWAVTLGVSF